MKKERLVSAPSAAHCEFAAKLKNRTPAGKIFKLSIAMMVIFAPFHSHAQTTELQQTLQLQQQLPSNPRLFELYEKLKAAPLDATVHAQLGETYAESSLDELALASFRHALKIRPGLAQAHLGAAKLFRKKELFALELNEIENAVAANPQHPELRLKLGSLYTEPKNFNYSKAKKQYEALQKMGSPLADELASRMGIESK